MGEGERRAQTRGASAADMRTRMHMREERERARRPPAPHQIRAPLAAHATTCKTASQPRAHPPHARTPARFR